MTRETAPEPAPGPPPPAERRRPDRVAAACLLAWLVPGGGHFFLGRRLPAVVFFLIVLATFSLGLAQGGKVYLADRAQPLSFLATFTNLALGPLDLVGRQAVYGRVVLRRPPDPEGPEAQALLLAERKRVERETYEYGTTYLLTAGLMNILLILDAFDIGIGRKA
ncbi:MAG: hypothetical protein HY509_05715 [Acidobacteria bacterium]|nr:hypothetical protein [Acidobacteriota bacterium]